MYSLIGSYITMRHTTWNTSSDLCAISYGGIYPRRIRVCIYTFFFFSCCCRLLARSTPSPKMKENTSNLYYHPIFPITHTVTTALPKKNKKKGR